MSQFLIFFNLLCNVWLESNRDLGCLPNNNSAGDLPVVVCGVSLYMNNNLDSLCSKVSSVYFLRLCLNVYTIIKSKHILAYTSSGLELTLLSLIWFKNIAKWPSAFITELANHKPILPLPYKHGGCFCLQKVIWHHSFVNLWSGTRMDLVL